MAGFTRSRTLGGVEPNGLTRCVATSDSASFDNHKNAMLPAWVASRAANSAAPQWQIESSTKSKSGGGRAGLSVDKQFFTVRETASFFQVSEKTIRRLIARGELPAVRLGRSIRIDPQVIDKNIKKNE